MFIMNCLANLRRVGSYQKFSTVTHLLSNMIWSGNRYHKDSIKRSFLFCRFYFFCLNKLLIFVQNWSCL